MNVYTIVEVYLSNSVTGNLHMSQQYAISRSQYDLKTNVYILNVTMITIMFFITYVEKSLLN